MRIQTLNSLYLIWKFLISNFWSLNDLNKFKGSPSLQNKIYFLLKEILKIFYIAKFKERIYPAEIDRDALNLSALAFNYKLYEETIYLAKFYLWVVYCSDENNQTSNDMQTNFIEKWFMGVEYGFSMEDFEKKMIEDQTIASVDLVLLFVRRTKALINIKKFEEVHFFLFL